MRQMILGKVFDLKTLGFLNIPTLIDLPLFE